MLWTVKKLETEGTTLAELTLSTGKYKDPGYALMYLVVPLAHAPLYPLGRQFNMADLMPAFQSSSSYSPDTDAENNAEPTLVERTAGIDMVPESGPEVQS